jgi:predicted transcriptional regulator
MTSTSNEAYTLTVRLDRELAGRLKQVAHKQQKSMSEIVAGLIESWVTRKENEWATTK